MSFDLEKVDLKENEDHPLLGNNLSKEEVSIGRHKNTHYYQMRMYFGSAKEPANLIIDMSSAQTLVSSELCTKCPTMAYKPGESSTVEDLGTQWDLKYPELRMRFKTIAYKDTVCMSHPINGTDHLCAGNFTFYSIYKQKGMKQWQGGIVGVGPMPEGDDSDKSDSFIYSLAKQVEIKRPMFSVLISADKDLHSNVMFGDFNTTFIEGGEEAIQWYDITNKTSWQVYLSWAVFGDKQLFEHEVKEASVNLAIQYIGVNSDTWAEVSRILQAKDNSILCEKGKCFGTKSIEHYAGILPDFSFKVANKEVYTIPGSLLMDEITGKSDYTCRFVLYNAGYHFVLGEYFLKNYYSIYDMNHFKIGLAPVKNVAYYKNQTHEDAAVLSGKNMTGETEADKEYEKEKKTGLIIICMVVLFILACGLGCWMMKKRRQNSNDKLLKLQASGHDEELTDEDEDDEDDKKKDSNPNEHLTLLDPYAQVQEEK